MKRFRQFAYVFLSVILLLMCLAGDSEVKNLSGEFVPVIRFAVASDIHISEETDIEAERLKKLLESSYSYASSSAGYNKLDALVIVGDITDEGRDAEFRAFMNTVNSSIKDETQLITVMGNHDIYNNGQIAYKEIINPDANVDITINSFHFIGISPDPSIEYSYTNESLGWLGKAVKNAAKEDPEKPIFTFQHHHLKDTVYTSSEWYTSSSSMLMEIYNKYPQIVNFSGHSHAPINNPNTMWQDGFTALGTGTLSFFELTSEMTYGSIPPNSEQAAQFYIVEVDVNNTVRILPYNLITDEFFRTPANNDGDAQLIYTIDNPSKKNGFYYTDRKSNAQRPAFEKNARLEIVDLTSRSATVKIPQAIDSQAIYSYEIVCASDSGTQTFEYFSEFYFEPLPEALVFRLSRLDVDTEYTVAVTPINCYGIKGGPIKCKFSTEENNVLSYVSANSVEFSGTFTNFESVTELKQSSDSYAYGGDIGGDIYVGTWDSSEENPLSKYELAKGVGYNGSAALGIWAEDDRNQGIYIFATEENKNTSEYPELKYLRVWVDFTEVNFRKACFGLISPTGELYTTDEGDGRNDQEFWYLPEGSSTWIQYVHGDDGCFGELQGCSVEGFKGWLAFPIEDFLYRKGTGTNFELAGTSYYESEISGVYFFWDYRNASYIGEKFYIDEVQIVSDYKVFEEYKEN